MNKINLLAALAGLSSKEATTFIGADAKNQSQQAEKLRELIDIIDNAANQGIDQIEKMVGQLPPQDSVTIELGYCVDDTEAQTLGYPCVGAHNAMLARVIHNASSNIVIDLVPRGSTPGTAAAIYAHNK